MLLEILIRSSWVNAAFSFSMAALVLFSRPMTRVKFLWSAMCISIGCWAVAVALMATAPTPEQALTAVRLVNFNSILIPTFLLHSVCLLLGVKNKWLLGIAYASSAVLFAFNGSGRLSTIQVFPPFPYYNARLWPYDIFVAHFVGLFVVVEWLTWKKLRQTSDPRRRSQLRFLFGGIMVGFIGGQTTIPIVYGINFYPVGILFIPVFILAIGWGMLHHQLFDFRFAIRRVSLVLVIYVATALAILPVGWPSLVLLKNHPQDVVTGALTVGILGAVFLMSGPIVYFVLVRRSGWLRTFLSTGFSHDIRSPLANIESAAEMIRALSIRETIDRQKVQGYAEMIERNARQLNQFSSGMLALMKSENSHDQPRTLINLVGSIHEVVESLRALLEEKDLSVDIPNRNDLHIFVNPEGFRSIISNLLSNAIRFSQNGVISISATVVKDETTVTIRDRGQGLPTGTERKIFDRFYQATNKRGGTGLGLTIAKNWVEAHGGRIWAESEGEGKGTTVTFTLPTTRG